MQRKKSKWLIVATVSALAVCIYWKGGLLKIPSINYEKSTYTISCIVNGDSFIQRTIPDVIPGSYLNFTAEPGRRQLIPSYKSRNADVIAKFICSGSGELKDGLPVDPELYAQRVLASPDFDRVAVLPKNYGFLPTHLQYEPSIPAFVLRVASLVAIIFAPFRFL